MPTGAAVTDIGAFAIATDKFGHVTQTRALSTSASEVANHKHTVAASGTVTVPTVSATGNKKLSVTVTKDTDFLTGVTPVVSKLNTVSIIPAKSNGTVTPAVAVEVAHGHDGDFVRDFLAHAVADLLADGAHDIMLNKGKECADHI